MLSPTGSLRNKKKATAETSFKKAANKKRRVVFVSNNLFGLVLLNFNMCNMRLFIVYYDTLGIILQ